MTLKIDRESMGVSPEGLDQAVEAHKAALAEYAEHLKGVVADAANEDMKPEERRVAFPPPSAHPLVEQIVQAGGYELVGPSLEVRKQRLFQQVSEAESADLAKVTPPGKARYFQMREQAILQVDQQTRSNGDTHFLQEQAARREKQAAIQFWAAKQHHDIEDLTEETVDGWKMEGLSVG